MWHWRYAIDRFQRWFTAVATADGG